MHLQSVVTLLLVLQAVLRTGLVADTTGLRMAKTEQELAQEKSHGCETPERALLMTRPAFGGNIMATMMCPRTKPQMATVRPGVMKKIDKDETRTGELIKLDVPFTAEDMNVEILEVVKSEKKIVDITEAKVLVSGGRGVGKDGSQCLKTVLTYSAAKLLLQEQTLMTLLANGLNTKSGWTDR